MTSVRKTWGATHRAIPPFSDPYANPTPFRAPVVIPPLWDDRADNVRKMIEENRLQILESRQQMAEIRNLLSGILRNVEISQSHINQLERKIDEGTMFSYRFPRENSAASSLGLCTPPKRSFSIIHTLPLSPAPTVSTDSCELSYENPDLDLSWNSPAWLGEQIIEYPYRSRLILPLSDDDAVHTPIAANSPKVTLLHTLPLEHRPEEVFQSPFGRIGAEQNTSNVKQQESISIRRIDTDERTMSFIDAECDRCPIALGGLYEPIVQGRFPDEPDIRRAFILRTQRWGVNPKLHLHRLPRRELLLPNELWEAPDETLKQRHKTWYFTYRVWYSFVSNVGPARFPGLLDESWESILESPPEEARTRFSEALHQYTGYIGTSTAESSSSTYYLSNIIPDLLLAFDEAVQSPWPIQKPLTDLIIDLDEFESQRTLETRDTTRLWRGILWNTFPKHCMKHIRVGSVGGSDSRWNTVHAEFSERLENRRALWERMGMYRFPQGVYLPSARDRRTLDREERLKQMVHESAMFANILLCWKDGPLHLKHAVVPSLIALSQADSLDDSQLDQWQQLCQTVQDFYKWKSDPSKSLQK